MLRVRYGAVAIVAVVWAGLVSADDSKKDKDHGKSCMHATVSKLDTQKGSITVKITDREGKEQENHKREMSELRQNGNEVPARVGEEPRICGNSYGFHGGHSPSKIRVKRGKSTTSKDELQAK